jgi:hypothetical protein
MAITSAWRKRRGAERALVASSRRLRVSGSIPFAVPVPRPSEDGVPRRLQRVLAARPQRLQTVWPQSNAIDCKMPMDGRRHH